MKLLLFCIAVFLLFFVSKDAERSVKEREYKEKEESVVLRNSRDGDRLFRQLTIAYRQLRNSFTPIVQTSLQMEQEKSASWGLRFANNAVYGRIGAGGTASLCMNQFTAFLSGRHLHGFYIFFLSKLLI